MTTIELIKSLLSYLPSYTECNGYKCKEPYCGSCRSEEDVDACLEEIEELREAAEEYIRELETKTIS